MRQVLPKGRSFDKLTQADVTLPANHISSVARGTLDGKCPHNAAKDFIARKRERKMNMKNLKKYASILLVLVLCLSMAACGKSGGDEEDIINGDETGYEVDVINGDETGYEEDVINEDDTGYEEDVISVETQEQSNIYGSWYYKGDNASDYQTVLTLNEDGTYTRSDAEEGTYTFEELEVSNVNPNTNETTTELRQMLTLSGGFMDTSFYLVNDGQVLVDWSKVNEGEEFYVHESALENGELLKLYQITDGNSYWGEEYTLAFLRDNTLYRNYLNGSQDPVFGTWEISGDTITITWDDGETDEAVLDPENPDSLTLSSTGETFAKLF